MQDYSNNVIAFICPLYIYMCKKKLLRFCLNMWSPTFEFMEMEWKLREVSDGDAELLGFKLVVGVVAILISTLALVVYFCSTRKPKGCLDPEKFEEFKLIKRSRESHDTDKFRFVLPKPTSVLGLPVGQHVICKGKDYEGKEVIRPYTPITLDSDVGFFELLVKMYPKGRMSHHFKEMREGDYLPVKGPKGRFKYKVGQVRAFGMIAGGSGITPMFQLIRAILENPKDKTNVQLIYANRTLQDILLKQQLDSFAAKFPDRFQVYYVLSQAPETEEWKGGIGHVSKEMIQRHCPAPAPDIQILICGPPGMNKTIVDHLNALGYTSDMQFEF